MAVPRLAPPDGNAGVALPQPLDPSDAALARQAFVLQARGELAGADRDIVRMQSDLLLGPLQAQRYLGRFHQSTAAELTAWLDHFASQPDAAAIRALLRRRLPRGAALPPLPVAAPPPNEPVPPPPPLPVADDPPPLPRQPALEAAVAARVDHGNAAAALHLIDRRTTLSPAYASLLRGEVARGLFARNDDSETLHVARQAIRGAPAAQEVGLAPYVGGLAAWRLGRRSEARQLFVNAAEAPLATPSQRAAAAFWSARAAEQADDAPAALHWLREAAAQRTTLHGILARRMLGLPTGIVPSNALLSQADVDAIAATDAGWRAFALLQVGQPERASAELQSLWPDVRNNPPLRRALLLVAAGVGLSDCAAQLAAWNAEADPDAGDLAQVALPPLHPAGGFRIDPALVYALTRVESNFDPAAVSAAGARGLMQLMPATVQSIDSRVAVPLHDPALNLELGQRYLLYLAAQESIGDNLLRLLASYNAGPNAYLHWAADIRDERDPLLFIEAIPNDETRRFVERTLTFSWIYAARLHLPAPSLDEMAAGSFPRFTPPAAGRKIAEAWLP
ncbi:MAG TPA: lytic transglycosylase domain-containing protein [Acetobacteraceae bacterium]|nr:lytic transglycosylase domain-containing protein [Acetobacteraceae bacterium]